MLGSAPLFPGTGCRRRRRSCSTGSRASARATRTGERERSYNAKYEGVVYIERRHAEAESDTSRERFAGGRSGHVARPGPPASLAVTVGGKNIAEVSLSIDEPRPS